MRNHHYHRRQGSLLWFVCVGWWLGLAWLCLALCFAVTIIGIPLAWEMLEALPAITTLR